MLISGMAGSSSFLVVRIDVTPDQLTELVIPARNLQDAGLLLPSHQFGRLKWPTPGIDVSLQSAGWAASDKGALFRCRIDTGQATPGFAAGSPDRTRSLTRLATGAPTLLWRYERKRVGVASRAFRTTSPPHRSRREISTAANRISSLMVAAVRYSSNRRIPSSAWSGAACPRGTRSRPADPLG